MKRSPAYDSIGHVLRKVATDIGTDYRLLERYEDVGERVQVTASVAPDVGDIHFISLAGPVVQGCFEFVIVRASSVGEP